MSKNHPLNKYSSSPSQESCETAFNFILKVFVEFKNVEYFESEWLPGIYDVLLHKRGFRHRIVIPPSKNKLMLAKSNNDFVEYIIILYFIGLDNLRSWQLCDDRLLWLEYASKRGIIFKHWIDEYAQHSSSIRIDTGIESYSDSPDLHDSSEPTRLALQNTSTSPPLHALPPPKWKLFIVIDLGALASVLSTLFAHGSKKMARFGIPNASVIFLTLLHVVGILVYGVTPTLLSLPWINAWMRAPRGRIQDMHPVHRLLDQGLAIFAAPAKDTLPASLQKRLEILEEHVFALRRVNHELRTRQDELLAAMGKSEQMHSNMDRHSPQRSLSSSELRRPVGVRGEGLVGRRQSSSLGVDGGGRDVVRRAASDFASLHAEPSQQQHSAVSQRPVTPSPEEHVPQALTMVVAHFVKWERELDFLQWTERVTALMAAHEGFLGLVSTPPEKESDPFVNTFSFVSYERLQEFMDDPNREVLMSELEPMLQGTTVAQISQERVMHDAFSELFVSTGAAAPSRPPPMWKTYMLIMLSLQMIAWPLNTYLLPLLRDGHVNVYVATALVTSLNVFVSNYVGVPFLHLLFGHWLQTPRPKDIPQPWKTLDSGFTPFQRVLVIIIYFVPLLVVGTLDFLKI